MFAALSDDEIKLKIEPLIHGFIALAPVVFLSKVSDKVVKFAANYLSGLLKLVKAVKLKRMMFSKCNNDSLGDNIIKKLCSFTLTKGICTN